MPKFQISTYARVMRVYEVEAASAEEAKRLWQEGGLDPTDECDEDEHIDEIEELKEDA